MVLNSTLCNFSTKIRAEGRSYPKVSTKIVQSRVKVDRILNFSSTFSRLFCYDRLRMKRLWMLSLLCLAGCFQAYDPDDDLRTVPVTNNPHVVPSHGGGLPGIGAAQGPY